jgi:hypothetical protein
MARGTSVTGQYPENRTAEKEQAKATKNPRYNRRVVFESPSVQKPASKCGNRDGGKYANGSGEK